MTSHLSSIYMCIYQSADLALQAQRDVLASSITNCIIAATMTVVAFPTILIPSCALAVCRKRSINHALTERSSRLPDDYWHCVARVMLAYVVFNTGTLWYMSTSGPSRVPWSLQQFTILNSIVALPVMLFLHDFGGYWYHRFAHSKLLCHFIHEKHHVVEHCNSLYDGFYGEFLETCIQSLLHFTPIVIMPGGAHVIVVMAYTLYIILFKVALNHCGREAVVAITLPLMGRLEIFNSQHHDDHHAFRYGNYADMFPIIDEWFHTEVKLKRRRRTLPGVKLWRRAFVKLEEHQRQQQREQKGSKSSFLVRQASVHMQQAAESIHRYSTLLMEVHPDCLKDLEKIAELDDLKVTEHSSESTDSDLDPVEVDPVANKKVD